MGQRERERERERESKILNVEWKKKEQELQMVFKQSCALGTGPQSECMDKAKHIRSLDGAFIFVDSITAMEGTAENSAKYAKSINRANVPWDQLSDASTIRGDTSFAHNIEV